MAKLNTVIGIDPGFDGGIALLHPPGEIIPETYLEVLIMPVIEAKGKPRPGRKSPRTIRELDEVALRSILSPFANEGAVAFLEKQQPMLRYDPNRFNEQTKRMGMNVPPAVQSTWNLAGGYMFLRGLLCGLKIGCVLVPPKTWQCKMLGGMERTDTKKASIQVAQRMYPSVDFRRSERCRNYHDGMTDAALIATYGWQTMFGGTTGWQINRVSFSG